MNPARSIIPGVLAILVAGCSVPHQAARGHASSPAASGHPVVLSASGAPFTGGPVPGALARAAPVPLTAQQILAGADPTDATAVGEAFARATWTIDTTVDTSEAQAEERLAALMAPALAAQVGADSTAGPGATFLSWASHRAVTTATAVATSDSGGPPDTDTAAYRSFVLTVTPAGRDGWQGPDSTEVEFVTLSRQGAGQPWLVANVM
jgi:hypothetical protein